MTVKEAQEIAAKYNMLEEFNTALLYGYSIAEALEDWDLIIPGSVKNDRRLTLIERIRLYFTGTC